jgi:beta-phosphoglucomutase-like phosphatase (HAD superfamily)
VREAGRGENVAVLLHGFPQDGSSWERVAEQLVEMGLCVVAPVVFDCDGTLIDSERVTVAGMREALRLQGHTLTDEDVAAMVGYPWPRTRARMVERFGLTDRDVETYCRTMTDLVRSQVEDDGLVFADVVATLAALREHGMPLAVCASSGRAHRDRVLSVGPLKSN